MEQNGEKVPVAVKVMNKQTIKAKGANIMVDYEMKFFRVMMIKRWEHKNLIRCFGDFEDEDNYYIVLEICKCDLTDLIK